MFKWLFHLVELQNCNSWIILFWTCCRLLIVADMSSMLFTLIYTIEKGIFYWILKKKIRDPTPTLWITRIEWTSKMGLTHSRWSYYNIKFSPCHGADFEICRDLLVENWLFFFQWEVIDFLLYCHWILLELIKLKKMD